MRKIFLFTFLTMLLASGQIMAQNFGFGIKAGANVANFRTDGDNFQARVGYLFGVYGNIRFSERVGFQPELLYSNQGAASKGNNGVDVNLSYLTVPMMFKVYLTPAVNLQLGPYFGIILEKDFRHELGDLNDDELKDSFDGYDFGAQGGINFENKTGFNVGIRYVYGFADINKNHNSSTASNFNSDFKNSLVSFALGYTF